jgi:hypothetical protein
MKHYSAWVLIARAHLKGSVFTTCQEMVTSPVKSKMQRISHAETGRKMTLHAEVACRTLTKFET